MRPLYVLGRGAFGREVYGMLSELHTHYQGHSWDSDDIVFLDDGEPFLDNIASMPRDADYVCAINDPRTRQAIIATTPSETRVRLIHPDLVHHTYDKNRFQLGVGSIICAKCYLTDKIWIGEHVHINTGTHIGHDARIGDFVTICGRVHICGEAFIGQGAYLSTGAIILPGITIGKGCVVGPGCVVHRDMKPNTKCANRGPDPTGMAEPWNCSKQFVSE